MNFFSTLNGLGQYYGEYAPPVIVLISLDVYISLGLTQTPPAQCVLNLQIENNREDLYIMPGVVNCISCNIMGSILWQIEVDRDLVPVTSSLAAQFASTMNNFLIFVTPEDYVEPGTSGRRHILCSAPAGTPSLEARLASPSKINIKGGDGLQWSQK